MTLLSITVLILTCLVARAFSEILHCYECDDCKTSNNTLLRACPETMTTIIPDNLMPERTTMSTTETTIITPTSTSSTSSPSSTTFTSTSSSTTISTTPESSDKTVPVSDPVSTLSPLSTTTVTAVEQNEDDGEKVLKRSVRQVNYRALMIRRFAREIDVSHHCYSIKGYGGDQKKIKKGCIKVIGNKNACDVLKEQYDVSAESCVVCKENKCNNSTVGNQYFVSYPVLVLLICFLIKNLV